MLPTANSEGRKLGACRREHFETSRNRESFDVWMAIKTPAIICFEKPE